MSAMSSKSARLREWRGLKCFRSRTGRGRLAREDGWTAIHHTHKLAAVRRGRSTLFKPSWRVVMKAWSKLIVVTIAACSSALVAGTPARAAEITVVAGGGPLPDVLGTLMPMFEKATGNKVMLSSKGAPQITADLKSGAADLVITNTEVVDDYATSGEVTRDGKTLLMISKIAGGGEGAAERPANNAT